MPDAGAGSSLYLLLHACVVANEDVDEDVEIDEHHLLTETWLVTTLCFV